MKLLLNLAPTPLFRTSCLTLTTGSPHIAKTYKFDYNEQRPSSSYLDYWCVRYFWNYCKDMTKFCWPNKQDLFDIKMLWQTRVTEFHAILVKVHCIIEMVYKPEIHMHTRVIRTSLKGKVNKKKKGGKKQNLTK